MIRVGIAGIGYIAEEYIKLFTGGKIHHATVTALSSRNESRMQEIKKQEVREMKLYEMYIEQEIGKAIKLGEEQGEKRGEERGEKRGEKKITRRYVLKMLSKGMSIEEISNLIDEPIEEIRSIIVSEEE